MPAIHAGTAFRDKTPMTPINDKNITGDDKNMPTRKGNKAIVIYFPPDQWNIVSRKAKEAKLRTGTYIRRMAVKGEIKFYDLNEFSLMRTAFASIGSNINQIARNVNMTGSVYQQDIEDMKTEFEHFRNVMNNYLVKISPRSIS